VHVDTLGHRQKESAARLAVLPSIRLFVDCRIACLVLTAPRVVHLPSLFLYYPFSSHADHILRHTDSLSHRQPMAGQARPPQR